MNASDYIEAMRKANPTIAKAEKISIKVKSFELALRRAFESGEAAARNEPRSLFEMIFGKGVL